MGGGAIGGGLNSMMIGGGGGGIDGNIQGGAAMGMRRTSLGFLPYLPTSNRRDSGFSSGGDSIFNPFLDSAITAMNGNDMLSGRSSSPFSSDQFRKMTNPDAANVNLNEGTTGSFEPGSAGGMLADLNKRKSQNL
jgi:hypothetical protein